MLWNAEETRVRTRSLSWLRFLGSNHGEGKKRTLSSCCVWSDYDDEKKLLVFVLSGKMDSPPKTSKQNDFSYLCIQRRETLSHHHQEKRVFFCRSFLIIFFVWWHLVACSLTLFFFSPTRLCNTRSRRRSLCQEKPPCPSLLKLFCSSSCLQQQQERRRDFLRERNFSRFNFNERREGSGGGG